MARDRCFTQLHLLSGRRFSPACDCEVSLAVFAWRVVAERLLHAQQVDTFSVLEETELGDAATLAFIAEIKKRLRQQHEDPPNT
jgi:hypothetical protein